MFSKTVPQLLLGCALLHCAAGFIVPSCRPAAPDTALAWKCGRASSRPAIRTGHALHMASDSPRKRAPKLGPGLFDPMIQLGPEDKWSPAAPAPADAPAPPLLVSRAELAALFAKIDADANGRIDAAELLVLALSLGHAAWTAPRAAAALRAIDADADGLIAADELYAWYAAGGMTRAAPAAAAERDGAAHLLSREEAESIFQVASHDMRACVRRVSACEFACARVLCACARMARVRVRVRACARVRLRERARARPRPRRPIAPRA